jgi:L-fucose isomerase-like protein
LDCIKKMRSSVILDVTARNMTQAGKQIHDAFGTEVRQFPVEEINAAYDKTDLAEARKCAGTWIQNAQKVVEPTREEITKSARMYHAMQEVMKENKSRAITIDCLQLFYGGKMPAYPCLGFFQLNNDGMVGACEADLQSTVSMLLMGYLIERPGYISDPVIDTSKNQIIYAHCVAPTKVYGPKGTSNPYHIRSHSEDRKGAAIRSIMPLGVMTTSLKFMPAQKEVVLHQAKAVANIDDDKACRTKLAAEVKDINKLMLDWDRGWHRVTFYGDHRQAVETVSALLGFKVVVEG